MKSMWSFRKLACVSLGLQAIAIAVSAWCVWTRRDAAWWAFSAQLFSLIAVSVATGATLVNLMRAWHSDKLWKRLEAQRKENATSGL